MVSPPPYPHLFRMPTLEAAQPAFGLALAIYSCIYIHVYVKVFIQSGITLMSFVVHVLRVVLSSLLFVYLQKQIISGFGGA